MSDVLTLQSAVSIDVDSIFATLEQAIPLARMGASLTPTPWDDLAVDGLEAVLQSEPLRRFLRNLFASDEPPLMAFASEPMPADVKAAAAEIGIDRDRLKKIIELAIRLLVLFG